MGFSIVTNGDRKGQDFLINLMKHAATRRYLSSNDILSSGMLYGIYSGLKFFYYGEQFHIFNVSIPQQKVGYSDHNDHPLIQEFKKKWSIDANIDFKEQRMIAGRELGVDCKLTPEEVRLQVEQQEQRLAQWARQLEDGKKVNLLHEIYAVASSLKQAGSHEALKYFSIIISAGEHAVENAGIRNVVSGSHYHSGEIAYNEGRLGNAFEHYSRCLLLNPQHRAALNAIRCINSSSRLDTIPSQEYSSP
jgi:hypothetical protein